MDTQYNNELTPDVLATFNDPNSPYPVVKIFRTATVGSRTRQGGEIRAVTYEFRWAAGYAVARVGDEVIYPDGSTARIISGAGFAHMIEGLPVALVGSELDNGDEIISTPQGSQMHCYRETDQLPEGFMVRMWGMK